MMRTSCVSLSAAAVPMPSSKPSGSRRSSKKAWDKERTAALFKRYKENGDLEARDQLIVNHSNLVHYVANKYANRGQDIDDLVQVGQVGLIKAVDGFDPSRGLEFTTYATPTIMGEIKRYFRDKGWSVRVPRRLQDLSIKVNAATEELTREFQRSPSVKEIAEYLGASVDDVLEAMESSSAYSSVSFDAPEDDDDKTPSLSSRYGEEDKGLVNADDRLDLSDVLRECAPREREILQMRFEENLTQSEIASRLGVSQVQVSRLLRRTLQKLQDRMGATDEAVDA